MSKWIKVKDQLPKLGQACLIWMPVCGRGEIEGAQYKGDGQWDGGFCSTRGQGQHYKVRYWMPLPDAPE